MKRLIVFLTLLAASPAAAEATQTGLCHGGDTVKLRVDGEMYILTYINDEAQTSRPCEGLISYQEVSVAYRIKLDGDNGAESLRVSAETPGYMTVPEYIEVPDGKDTEVQVMPAMY